MRILLSILIFIFFTGNAVAEELVIVDGRQVDHGSVMEIVRTINKNEGWPDSDSDEIDEKLIEAPEQVIFALINDTVVGYAAVRVSPQDENDLAITHDHYHISFLAILPSYRGQKIGTHLMLHLIEMSRQREDEVVTLDHLPKTELISFYKKIAILANVGYEISFLDNNECLVIYWL